MNNNSRSGSPGRVSSSDSKWARELIQKWKDSAKSNCIVYTYGFVSSPALTDGKKDSGVGGFGTTVLLLPLLTIVSLVIQTVVPLAIVVTFPAPDGLCPNQAKPLTKFIGLILCFFFVVLTISMCLNKLRGLGFLKLFCSNDTKALGCFRFFIDLGILSNMVSMAAAGTAQYLLFIRNADKDYVLLLLQSLAMQFVLTADEKLMTGAWNSWTRVRLGIVMSHDYQNSIKDAGIREGDEEGVGIIVSDEETEVIIVNEMMLKKVRLMYYAEATFLSMVSVVGVGWSISLAYCM